MEKLYIIVRGDLPAGAQCAQACHALRSFVDEHPALDAAWHGAHNNLVVLSCHNEAELLQLRARARDLDVPQAVFQEPDFDMQHTAIALAGTTTAQKMLSQLPLALKAA